MVFILSVSQTSASLTINGAGATFPYPIYSKWFAEYGKQNKDVRFNYQPIGSGGGIQQLLNSTVDFGATDVPMKEAEEKKSEFPIMHVPMVLGAVVIVFNLDEVQKGLKLTGELISKIFLGQITKWNDPLIQEKNKELSLPNKTIMVVHRSDGSGTTSVFTEYLTEVSQTWKKSVGPGKAVKWPTGIGAKGNDGVTGIIKQTKGSIGYIELSYALQNNLHFAAIKNKSGLFQLPTLETISNSADVLNENESKTSISNALGENTYPLSAITYLLIPMGKHQGEKRKGIKDFLVWALSEGQVMAPSLHYAPLPLPLREKMQKKILEL